jgi:catechol-2,3-dioxygenase
MPITRLNHAVLYVRDAQRSASFYEDVLGFRRLPMAPSGMDAVFMQAPGSTNDLAWEVDTLEELERLSVTLSEAGALVGASDHGTTKSLYGKDPDGIEFEIAWIIPAELLDDDALGARKRIGRLDLAKEKERYGATTRGGVGVSSPA